MKFWLGRVVGRRVPARQVPGPDNKVILGRRVPATVARRVPACFAGSRQQSSSRAPGTGKLGGPRQARRQVPASKIFQGAGCKPGAAPCNQLLPTSARQVRRQGRNACRSALPCQNLTPLKPLRLAWNRTAECGGTVQGVIWALSSPKSLRKNTPFM